MSMKQVSMMHIILASPILYIYGNDMDEIKDTYLGMFKLLVFMIPFIVRFPNIKDMSRSDWINAAHWFLFLPAGLYLISKKRHDKGIYDLVKYAGIAVLAIHIYIYITKYAKS